MAFFDRTDMPPGMWRRDAWTAGVDVAVAAALAVTAAVTGAGWLWIVAVLWACLAAAQGRLAVKSRHHRPGPV
ncbi:hypothetical protein [Prescottella equi]